MDWTTAAPIFSLIVLVFVAYRLEKLHDMLTEWYMDWEEVNKPRSTDFEP